MRIINPTFGSSPGPTDASSAVAGDWRRDRIALFGNNKPNAKELLLGVAERLAAMRTGGGTDYLFKPSASQPAPAALLDEIGRTHKLALVAIGD